MKLNTETPNSNSLGIEGAKEFSIDTSNQMIVSILRDKLYSNKIGAVCREVASNSRDANREAGRGEVPIKISIYNEESVSDEIQYFISFQDNGVGISPDRIENVFLKYGSSTKRNSNSQTGGFGIGAKTPFAYNNEFLIETVSEEENGKKLKCIYQAIIMNETGIETSNLIPILQEETTEDTGTKIIIPINQKDIRNFEKECLKATMFWSAKPTYEGFVHFKNIEIKKHVSNNNWSIFSGQYSEILDVYSYEMFLLVDEIPYTFSLNNLDVKSSDFNYIKESFILNAQTSSWQETYTNLVICFETGDLSLSASREDIEYTESNILKIQDEIKKAEKDLVERVKKMINDKESLIEKSLFINSFKEIKSGNLLGQYLKRLDIFEKIKGEYEIPLSNNEVLKKHYKSSISSKDFEVHKFENNISYFRISSKTLTATNFQFTEELLKNCLILFKESKLKTDSQINRTLTNLHKTILLINYNKDNALFDKENYKKELTDLMKSINVEVKEYSEVEKTKPPKRQYSTITERPKQDKNIRTVYVRKITYGGRVYKESYKYKVEEKRLCDENDSNLIIIPLLEGRDLKDLDKTNVSFKGLVKDIDISYLNQKVTYREIFGFIKNLGYNIIIVKNVDYPKIKNTPKTTIEKVFENLLKDKKVLKAIQEQIERDYINGSGMILEGSEDYIRINKPTYKLALSLVGFDINDYKIFKIEKEKRKEEEEDKKIKFNHSDRNVNNAIKEHLSEKLNENKFEKFLSLKILKSFKEKLKTDYPLFHFALKEINAYYSQLTNYNIYDEEGSLVERGSDICEKQLLHMLKLEIQNKNKEGELIVNTTPSKRRGRPKGSKNKIKTI